MGLRESKNLPALIVFRGSGTEGEQKSDVDGFVFSRKWMFEICGPNKGQQSTQLTIYLFISIYIRRSGPSD